MLITVDGVASVAGRAGGRSSPRVLAADGPLPCDRLLAAADRYRWLLFATVACFYAAAFNGQWRVQSDAALYLSIGRNLAEGHGYTYLGVTNRLAYPGWPLMIAATFKLFGSASLAPVQVLMQLIALGTLAATYRLVLLHAGRPTAVLVTCGTSLTKAFFVYTLELWTDLPFAMAAMAVLAGYEGTLAGRPVGQPERTSRWYDWALLIGGLGLAVATRPTGWLLLMAAVIAIAVDAVRGHVRKRTVLPVALGMAVVAIASFVLLRRQVLGGTYAQYFLNRLTGVTSPLDRPLAQKVYELFAWAASDVLFQVRFGFAANSVLSALVLALGFGLYWKRALWGLWFALLLATVLLMVQETLDRYFLPVLPLLVYAWWSALVWVDRQPIHSRALRRSVDWAFLIVLGCGAAANVGKVGGLIAQQHAKPFLASYNQGCYQPMPSLSSAIDRRVGPDGLVLIKSPYGRVAAFLSRRDVVNAAEITPAALRGRAVFVVEPSDVKTQQLLKAAGLTVGPELFKVPTPPAGSVKAELLSLHATVPVR